MLAGRRGEETGSAVADSHRENAGRVPLRSALREAAPWRSAIGKMQTSTGEQLRSEVPVRSAIRKTLHAGRCAKEQHREDADDRELPAGSSTKKQHREATPPRKAAGKGAAAGFDF